MSESTKVTSAKPAPVAKPSVKDSGKVRVGAGAMRF